MIRDRLPISFKGVLLEEHPLPLSSLATNPLPPSFIMLIDMDDEILLADKPKDLSSLRVVELIKLAC